MAQLKKSNPKLYERITAQLNKNRRQKTSLTSYVKTPIEFSKRDYEQYILSKYLN